MRTTEDPRIVAGMTQQWAERRRRIAAGERPIGWKLGLGAKPFLEKLGLAGPLVGHMMASNRVPSGGSVSLAGWTNPVLEPEIAIRLGRDLGGGADRTHVAAAIDALAPAMELVDMHPPPTDIAAVLRDNIFHRHVVIGEFDPSRAGGSVAGLVCRAFRRGAEAQSTADPQASFGELIAVVAHLADVLAAFGEKLRAGDVAILGSTMTPLAIASDEEEVSFRLDPVGEVSVRFVR